MKSSLLFSILVFILVVKAAPAAPSSEAPPSTTPTSDLLTGKAYFLSWGYPDEPVQNEPSYTRPLAKHAAAIIQDTRFPESRLGVALSRGLADPTTVGAFLERLDTHLAELERVTKLPAWKPGNLLICTSNDINQPESEEFKGTIVVYLPSDRRLLGLSFGPPPHPRWESPPWRILHESLSRLYQWGHAEFISSEPFTPPGSVLLTQVLRAIGMEAFSNDLRSLMDPTRATVPLATAITALAVATEVRDKPDGIHKWDWYMSAPSEEEKRRLERRD